MSGTAEAGPAPADSPRMARSRLKATYRVARDLVDRFGEHDLLSFASAIAFQVLYALVPLLLAGLAILGFLGLEDIWRDEIAPTVEERIRGDAFSLLDRTVEQILTERRGLWLTFGVAFALWQLSGAIRAAMGPLNTIYGVEENRRWYHRFAISIALAASVGPLILLAFLGLFIGDELVAEIEPGPTAEILLEVGRFTICALLLLGAIWIVLHFTPAIEADFRWISAGSLFVIGSWTLATVGYGWYVTSVAAYETVFLGLAFIFVLMTYLYILAVTFLGGAQLDALLRERANGTTGKPQR